MKKEIIEVPKLSEALRKTGVPLSPVVRFGNMVFVSGIPPPYGRKAIAPQEQPAK